MLGVFYLYLLAVTFIFKINCVGIFRLHVCLRIMYVPGDCVGHKRAPDPLEMRRQMVCLVIWTLGIKPVSSGKAATALNH